MYTEQFPNRFTHENDGWSNTVIESRDGGEHFLNGERRREVTPEELDRWAATHKANIDYLAKQLPARAAAILKQGGEHHIQSTIERYEERTALALNDMDKTTLQELVGTTY